MEVDRADLDRVGRARRQPHHVVDLVAVEQQVVADDLALGPGAPAAVALVEQRVEVLALIVVGIEIAGEIGEPVGEVGVQGSDGEGVGGLDVEGVSVEVDVVAVAELLDVFGVQGRVLEIRLVRIVEPEGGDLHALARRVRLEAGVGVEDLEVGGADRAEARLVVEIGADHLGIALVAVGLEIEELAAVPGRS